MKICEYCILRSQYKYAINRDSGYHIHNILQIRLGDGFPAYSEYLSCIKANPDVINAAGMEGDIPRRGSAYTVASHHEKRGLIVKIEKMEVDYGFFETMGIELLEGRDFSTEYGNDIKKNSTIVNEATIRQLGIRDPINEYMDYRPIIGVVRDFNLNPVTSEIPALSIDLGTSSHFSHIVIHYKPGTLGNILPAIKAEWEKIVPDKPFYSSTIEDILKDNYAAEKNLMSIVSIAAVLTILIAAFGLLGLTLFITRTRIKETGIRKVFGCSGRKILISHLSENLAMVFIATIVSVPVTVYFMSDWLTSYSYRTEIKWWTFLITFATAGLLVIITVFSHSLKVSRTNPSDALRYE